MVCNRSTWMPIIGRDHIGLVIFSGVLFIVFLNKTYYLIFTVMK